MKVKLYIALLLFPIYLEAQEPVKTQDPAAEPYLDNISGNLRTDEAYQVEFRYEIYSAREDARVGDFGSIIIKDNKYKLKTEDSEVIYNGEFLWVYNKIAAEVYKSQPEEGNSDQMLADPFRLLGNYKEYYKYQLKGKKKIDGTEFTEIDLYPVDLDAGYSYLRILCNQGGKNIHSISMRQKNGTEITVFINEIVRDLKIPESIFSWDPETYPDVLLIEM
jgi:outer membrane lipoprotein-sorting protein